MFEINITVIATITKAENDESFDINCKSEDPMSPHPV